MIEPCPRPLLLHCSVMESLPDSPTKTPSVLFGKLDCGMGTNVKMMNLHGSVSNFARRLICQCEDCSL
ncbi:hypothetical protein EUGRSUZ_C00461 [Eucalyptus grandis]|uniref:Uncharacterized protein n=2 Tax=Eucalyptus grandis TaxID=71139 RepID=A0ACC3LAD6_EUCGR|nr:hypothetical protein EUGRSUZ_C00461 [Eucalyptus grandis]